MSINDNDISNQELFDLLVKVAGRLDIMENRFDKLENEIVFIKAYLANQHWRKNE